MIIRELVSRMVRGRGPAVQVQRRVMPYWQERGWIQSGNSYRGTYQTEFGAFLGRAEQRGSQFFRFYIQDPPSAVLGGAHAACFIDQGGGRYEVHMGRMPGDVSSGIITLERLLRESFN